MKNPMNPDEKPMDEFEWEGWMKKNDAMADTYQALFEKYKDDPDCDEKIAREMGWDHLLEDDGIERPWLDDVNASLDEPDENEEGEEWKTAAGIKDDNESDRPDFHNDPLYTIGFDFSLRVLDWYKQVPESLHGDPDVRATIDHGMIPSAKIAGAGSFEDDDKDYTGMRLAVYKRGLESANKTVAALNAILEKKLLDARETKKMIADATELRNALALRIQEVREKFNGM